MCFRELGCSGFLVAMLAFLFAMIFGMVIDPACGLCMGSGSNLIGAA